MRGSKKLSRYLVAHPVEAAKVIELLFEKTGRARTTPHANHVTFSLPSTSAR